MPCFPSYTRTPYSTLFPYTTLFRSASQVHLYSNAELADIDLQIAHLKLAALGIEIDELTPDHLRGRANSAFWLLSFGAEPLGVAAAGALLGSLGLSATIGIFASLLAALALGATLNREIRRA